MDDASRPVIQRGTNPQRNRKKGQAGRNQEVGGEEIQAVYMISFSEQAGPPERRNCVVAQQERRDYNWTVFTVNQPLPYIPRLVRVISGQVTREVKKLERGLE